MKFRGPAAESQGQPIYVDNKLNLLLGFVFLGL